MKMNNRMRLTVGIAVLLVIGILTLTGCKVQEITPESTATPETTESPTAASNSEDSNGNTVDAFSYSDGIDDSGYWEGVTALDFVELAEYKDITIPADTQVVAEEDVQAEITNLLAEFVTEEQTTDRPVADGDTINIDYVGSVDGVEFENGSTNGTGTTVTIGVTSYIDDFLEQLIDHTPGENFNIEVTFPDPYSNNPDLAGKDAVFNVTINYITESVSPELTDAFVSENLSEEHGWTTVEEMQNAISEELRKSATYSYIQGYLFENSTVANTPESLVDYQRKSVLSYFQDYADMYGVSIEDFLATYVGYDSTDALLAAYAEDNVTQANNSLIIQAIAEDLEVTVTDEDVAAYFKDVMHVEDYSNYETIYGIPFLKQIVLYQTVIDYIAENAIYG